jgi:hypothetical protein
MLGIVAFAVLATANRKILFSRQNAREKYLDRIDRRVVTIATWERLDPSVMSRYVFHCSSKFFWPAQGRNLGRALLKRLEANGPIHRSLPLRIRGCRHNRGSETLSTKPEYPGAPIRITRPPADGAQ